MIKIKFSHIYEKFPPDLTMPTRLTDVELVNLENCDPAFIEADTAIVGGGHYPLPKKGKHMILWLFSTDGLEMHRWQTIRRWTAKKEAYYRQHIGELVKIEVME